MRRARALGVAVTSVVALALSACNPLQAKPDLDYTYNARQCIIDRESRDAGMYTAEYGGSPSGADGSTASGAYQWLNSSWQVYLPWAEQYYGISLTSPEEAARGARQHAAYASPYAQDVVASYALIKRPQNLRPWPYSTCWALVGTTAQLRVNGPVNEPTPYVLIQINKYAAEERDTL